MHWHLQFTLAKVPSQSASLKSLHVRAIIAPVELFFESLEAG